MAQFGEILSGLRRDAGLTQKELAQVLHVTIGTVSNYENGVHYPDVDKLMDLARYFHVTTDYLLGLASSGMSPDVLEQELLCGKTAAEVISDIGKLSAERKLALSAILNDMNLGCLLEAYGEKTK